MQVHFTLNLRYISNIRIQNIDLSYELSGFPGPKKVTINNSDQELDGSYRMTQNYFLKKGETANIVASQRFWCLYTKADHMDHKEVYITVSTTSPIWGGIKNFLITGKLRLGGELRIESVKVQKCGNDKLQ